MGTSFPWESGVEVGEKREPLKASLVCPAP